MSGNSIIYTIALTEEKLYKIAVPLGQGSLSIGTKGLSKGKYDVWVEKGSVINWDAFNGFYTGAGEWNKEYYPYGDWPRFFYYSGDDSGFIEWSYKRKMESFHWCPHADAAVDLTNADIAELTIHTETNTVQIAIGNKIRTLRLSGRPENFDVKACTAMPNLSFDFTCAQTEAPECRLPVYKALENATSVAVNNSPVGPAFDCGSLLQFSGLKHLDLTGSMTNVSALAELKSLERIGLRFVPVIQDMPELKSFQHLKSFIGYNIEETAGKALRAELNKLKKEKELDFSSVTKLRKSIWFVTEYGIPFSGWEEKNAEIATKAYKLCMKKIKKAGTKSELREAVLGFIGTINGLEGIETSEREDAGEAVSRLMEVSALDIPQEQWQQWFDEARDF